MVLEKKHRKVFLSLIFLSFVIAVFIFSVYYSELNQDESITGMAVSDEAESPDKSSPGVFTNKLSGLIFLIVFSMVFALVVVHLKKKGF